MNHALALNSDELNCPWLSDQWGVLQQAFAQQQPAQSLLLTGNDGVGKLSLARRYAQVLLCDRSAEQQAQACGQCQACTWLAAGSHPDYLEISPEDKATTIKIDQVRVLKEKVSQMPHHGQYQVVILHPADKLTTAAANALLKTLEEPCASTILVLVSAHPDTLPQTIRSRCQTMHCQPRDTTEPLAWLHQQAPDLSNDKAAVLLAASNEAPLKALELANPHYFETREAVLKDLTAMLSGKQNPVAQAERWLKTDSDTTMQLDILLVCFQDMLRLKLGCASEFLTYTDLQDRLNVLALKVSVDFLERQIERCNKILVAMRRYPSINASLMLGDFFVGVSRCE